MPFAFMLLGRSLSCPLPARSPFTAHLCCPMYGSCAERQVRMLASGLVENLSITHLSLAHNKVADRGVRALAKLLDGRSVISVLELQVCIMSCV